jgi:hypothetical protein
MRRDQLLAIQGVMFSSAAVIMEQRNIKYAKPDDALMNFRDEGLAGITAILSNKLSRLRALRTESRNMTDESVKDTLVDIINYAVLFAAVDEEILTEGKV